MRRTGSLEALRETTAMEATTDEWPEATNRHIDIGLDIENIDIDIDM